jgi:hypothetical protein
MRKARPWNRRSIYLVILAVLLVSLVAILGVQQLGNNPGSIGGPLGYAISLIRPTFVQAATTTFPVDEAGIAAYVKLDSIDITDLTEALNFYQTVNKTDETYVIGTVRVENHAPLGIITYYYPHLYIGLDGWIVAYYLNTEAASRIMQWKGYTPGTINTTTLKDAIDIMCANIGVTNSTAIKYYDFEFPNANRMTLIAETVVGSGYGSSNTNSFSVTIPGTLYEASYSVVLGPYGDAHGYLSVDGVQNSFTVYDYYEIGYYNATALQPGVPHYVTLGWNSCPWCYAGITGGGATVLIYQN